MAVVTLASGETINTDSVTLTKPWFTEGVDKSNNLVRRDNLEIHFADGSATNLYGEDVGTFNTAYNP